MTTTIGGMDSAFAQRLQLPAHRISVCPKWKTGLNLLRPDILNIVVLYNDRSHIETDKEAWEDYCRLILPILKNYRCIVVVENEPSQLIGYIPKRYFDLLQATFTALGGTFQIYHGGLVMPVAFRLFAEYSGNSRLYPTLRTYGRARGIWGKLSQVQNFYQELSYIQQYGLNIDMNFHWQQFPEYLPQIVSYLLTLVPEWMNNELGYRDGLDATVEALITALMGKLSVIIWDNMVGAGGQIKPLTESGEKILQKYVS